MANSNTYTQHDISNKVFHDVSNSNKVMLVDSDGNPYIPSGGSAVTYETYDFDEAGSTMYVGMASSTGVYKIKRVIETAGDMTITFATVSNNPSVTTYANAWSNRATLNYSGAI